MNPIYIEYYSHENTECFKIDLPWGKYCKDTRVLCKISEGYEYAQMLAIGIVTKHLMEVIKDPPQPKSADEDLPHVLSHLVEDL